MTKCHGNRDEEMRVMLKTPLACTLAAALAGPALANCPGPADAAGAGVVLTYDDGSTTRLRLLADGVVEDLTWYGDPDGDGYLVVALYGLYTLDDVGLVDGQPDEEVREVQTFADPLKALPKPQPRLDWTGKARVVAGTSPAFDRDVSLVVGTPGRVEYGGCAYESFPATVRHRDFEADVVIRFDYLPALGIAVLRALGDHGGDEDSYNPVSIGVAAAGQAVRQ